MANSIFSLLVVFLLAATASARPCKTLFYFSATTTTTTTTYYPFRHHLRNPNPDFPHTQSPRYLTLIFTTTSRFPIRRPSLDFFAAKPSDGDSRSSPSTMTSSDFPLKFYSAVSSSIRDRSRDIMTVMAALAALLLGAACGALTAAVLYFVYALFSRRRRCCADFADVDSSSSDDDADDDIALAKKLSYMPIPAMPELVDDDLKKAKAVV